jgi:hypothetical protein
LRVPLLSASLAIETFPERFRYFAEPGTLVPG